MESITSIFHEVTSFDDFINTLRLAHSDNNDVVIHYVCECGDEQVTYEIGTDSIQELIDSCIKYGYMVLGYECTSCGVATRFLTEDNITKVEFI